MPTSNSSSEAYPGCDHSPSQLLYATKRKLQSGIFCGSIASTVNQSQVDALERDTLEVLRLIQFVKNSFVSINRIPPEILSLIPDYYGGDGQDDADKALIALTHVCRGWRDTFISRSSLWVRLDFENIDKIRTYIQRSRSSPLEIYLVRSKVADAAFRLMIPHICRLKSLFIDADALPNILQHFRCHAPLLEKLDISIRATNKPVLDGGLFKGDLSSLHQLNLRGVITHFPWKNLANLQVVSLESCFSGHAVTRLLDFFESAPLLHTVMLQGSSESPPDIPPERIVSLHHLKVFTIDADPLHLLLLRHLHIPVRASLVLELCFTGGGSHLIDHLPKFPLNFDNLSCITAMNVLFNSNQTSVLLNGPSGSLRMLVVWRGRRAPPSYTRDRQIFRSLDRTILSAIQRLTISKYEHSPLTVGGCPVFQTLSSTNNLRTLILIDCNNDSLARALDPTQNPSGLILCPHMDELVLSVKSLDLLHTKLITSMAMSRASRGAVLPSIIFYAPAGCGSTRRFKLRGYATRVEYRVGGVLPAWDDVPSESGGQSK